MALMVSEDKLRSLLAELTKYVKSRNFTDFFMDCEDIIAECKKD